LLENNPLLALSLARVGKVKRAHLGTPMEKWRIETGVF
jgi:hypothetical protein